MAEKKTDARPLELTESDAAEARGGANIFECLISSVRAPGPLPRQMAVAQGNERDDV